MACSICQEDVTSDAEHVLECGHTFHSSCLIRWLRHGNLSCPNCRDGLRLEDNLPTFQLRTRARYIRSTIGRRKSAPAELRAIIARLQRAEEKEREVRLEYRQHRQEHGDVIAKHNSFRGKIWTCKRRVSQCERLLGLFNCPGLTLPRLHVTQSWV